MRDGVLKVSTVNCDLSKIWARGINQTRQRGPSTGPRFSDIREN